MPDITIRRYQADMGRSHNDFVVLGKDAKALGSHLREVLRTAQAERGKGVWSEEDPEVWIGSAFVGRLGRDGDIALLARDAMHDLGASAAGSPPREPRT